ncbi:MAG TPA: ATP-binding protein, partial [Opitutales bacterium]|nr:ATP-binding protein [Opitutales bacterium]
QDEGDQNDLLRILLWCGGPAAALALGGGWWIMRRALNPVTALTNAAERLNERTLDQQLPRSGNGDELDRLTEVFNAMTARLNQSFLRVHEFTLHASHELKTPLAVLHGEIETELNDPATTPAQRELLLSRLDEIQRLTKIVDGLTLLTKADAGQIKLNQESVPLDELVREAYEDVHVLARASQVKVLLTHCDKLTINGDRHRLRQLLLNLTDNAIKYNRPEGRLEISLAREKDAAMLTLRNTTMGFDPQVLPRLFDRFYRGDPSHTNEVDGCGLGLSIAQWIVSAHDGTIALALDANQEIVVTVRLPLARMA